MERLSNSTLALLPAEVERPGYDRSTLSTGIVHFGVGGFHRSHQAMYLDRLMEMGLARDWGICGIGLMPFDSTMRDALQGQDCLYTLVVKHPDGRKEHRVIGSMIEYLYAPDDREAVLEKLADPAVRIVSLTVTEGGYNYSPSTGEFDFTNPAVIADLEAGAAPHTVFGTVVEGLARRRERGIAPFTVLSCDNVQGNGTLAEKMFTAFAERRDPELAEWIRRSVPFPNTMVDRITPVTTPADRAENDRVLGLEDAWPVVCEPFEQWIIEDRFTAGRPEFERAGAQLVQDVEPYELMKLRLLNCSHQAMAYFGFLSGYRYAHEALGDPKIVTLLQRYMDEEATPTLHEVPGVDLGEYKATLISRFSNPEIQDTLARLCAESSDRIPTWLVPVIREQLEKGGSVRLCAAIVASWARYAEGVDEQGEPIAVVDNLRERVMAAASRHDEDILAFLRDEALFGDLAAQPGFTAPYQEALQALRGAGAQATLEALLS